MEASLKAKWVEALRSKKYKQGVGALHVLSPDGHSYCCLGVLLETAATPSRLVGTLGAGQFAYGDMQSELSPYYLKKFSISVEEQRELVKMNDGIGAGGYLMSVPGYGKSFAEIADYIEENL